MGPVIIEEPDQVCRTKGMQQNHFVICWLHLEEVELLEAYKLNKLASKPYFSRTSKPNTVIQLKLKVG